MSTEVISVQEFGIRAQNATADKANEMLDRCSNLPISGKKEVQSLIENQFFEPLNNYIDFLVDSRWDPSYSQILFDVKFTSFSRVVKEQIDSIIKSSKRNEETSSSGYGSGASSDIASETDSDLAESDGDYESDSELESDSEMELDFVSDSEEESEIGDSLEYCGVEYERSLMQYHQILFGEIEPEVEEEDMDADLQIMDTDNIAQIYPKW